MDSLDTGSRVVLSTMSPNLVRRSVLHKKMGKNYSCIALPQYTDNEMKKRSISYSYQDDVNYENLSEGTPLINQKAERNKVKREQPLLRKAIQFFLVNLCAGLIGFLLSATIAVSCATVVFGHGTALSKHVSNVIAMNFLGTTILCLILAIRSTAPWALGAIDVFVAPIMGEMANAISISLNHDIEVVLPTSIVMISLTSTLLGLTLYLIGLFKITSVANYMPFPVIAGFLSGVGAALIKNGIHMAMGKYFSHELFTAKAFFHFFPALLFTTISRFSQYKKFPVAITFPVLFIVSLIFFHAARHYLGFNTTTLKEHDWIFSWEEKVMEKTPMWYSWSRIHFYEVRWSVLFFECWGYFLTLLLLGVLKYSVFVSSLSTVFGRDISSNEEMKVIGIGNIFAGLCGCNGGCHYLSAMGILQKFKAHERGPAIVASVCFLLIWLAGFSILEHVPKFVFGGLLMNVGLHFIEGYLLIPAQIISTLETITICCILVSFLFFGMLQSVGLGLIISLCVLVYRIHSIGCIRHESTGALTRSTIDRTIREMKYLDAYGCEIHILSLQGFVFFGTSVSILERVSDRIECTDVASLKFLVIDFTLVPNFDATALNNFRTLSKWSERHMFQIVYCGVRPNIHKTLKSNANKMVHFYVDLDEALEVCENMILPDEYSYKDVSIDRNNVTVFELWEEFLAYQAVNYSNKLISLAVHLDLITLYKDQLLDQLLDPMTGENSTYFICSGCINISFDPENLRVLTPRGSSQLKKKESIKAYEDASHTKSLIFRRAGPGSVIGNYYTFGIEDPPMKYIAATDCVALSLSEDSMMKLEESSPGLSLEVLKFMYGELSNRYQQSSKRLSNKSSTMPFSDRHNQLDEPFI